jgi:hypothetical protein
MRLIRHSDREQLAAWIAQDPEHKDSFLPEFWYERNRVSFVIEDGQGAVMYVKLVPEPRAMRLYIQFCDDPSRVGKAMLRHFSAVREMVARTGATSLVFDTRNPKLAAFCSKAFGFSRVGESADYRLSL